MAQLDRASPSEGGDCAFESRRVRQQVGAIGQSVAHDQYADGQLEKSKKSTDGDFS